MSGCKPFEKAIEEMEARAQFSRFLAEEQAERRSRLERDG
jgi:hypothetical protein